MADILGWLGDAAEAVNNAKDKVLEVGGDVLEGLDRFADEVHSPLTTTEHEIVENIFGESVDYDKITTIDEAAFTYINGFFNSGERPFVFGNNIYFPEAMDVEIPLSDYDYNDPAERGDFNRLLNQQALLVHETAHVWQFQNDGFGYIFDSFSNQNYHYSVEDLRNNTSLSDFGVEQAAGIAEAYHILSNLPDDYFNGTNQGQWHEPGHLDFTVTTPAERDEMLALMQPFINEYRAGAPQEGFIGEVNEGIFEVLDAAVDGLQETTREVDEAINEVKEEWQSGNYLGAAWEVFEGGFEVGREILEGIVTVQWERIEATAEIGWAALEAAGGWAWGGIQDAGEWAWNGIQDAGQWVSDGLDQVGGWISDGVDQVSDWAGGAANTITNGVNNIFSGAGNLISNIGSGFGNVVSSLFKIPPSW